MSISPLPLLHALVLAGGDGTRLQDLTRRIMGSPMPKQYCRIDGEHSLLESTLDRVAPLAPPERTMAIVNRDHLPIAASQLSRLPAENVLVQPSNRDTGPGILLSLLELEKRDPEAWVCLFPSDHYIADGAAFRSAVLRAVDTVAAHPDRLVLVGIVPEHADTGMGYIEPAAPLATAVDRLALGVRSFIEKPSLVVARKLVGRGSLWNSFVLVFRVARALELLERERPLDVARMRAALGEPSGLESAYKTLEPWNFSSDFLALVAPELAVVRAEETGWCDWGTPEAIERTFLAEGRTPSWLAQTAAC